MKVFTTAVVLLCSGISACKKSEGGNNLQSLYREYRDGSISECLLDGRKVYCADYNAYDGGVTVYGTTGKSLATCNYAWNVVDPACSRLRSCEVIYRCADHISGEPPVDKYHLSR